MYRYQTFGSRFLATIIDGVLISILTIFVFNTIIKFSPQPYLSATSVTLIRAGLFYFYSIFLHYKYGQTLGKKITNVKVVSKSDETKLITLADAFKRDSIGIILVLIGIFLKQSYPTTPNVMRSLFLFSSQTWMLAEIITMLFNKKRRAIHDFLANSVVIDVKVYPGLETDSRPKNS